MNDRTNRITSIKPSILTLLVLRRGTPRLYASSLGGLPKIGQVNMVRIAARTLAAGARPGNTALAGLGAAVLAVGLLRRRAPSRRRLLYARTLSEGETIRIAVRGPKDEASSDDGAQPSL